MNQFDALMGQISDLEGVNRDAERKIVAVTQHSNSLESELSSGTVFTLQLTFLLLTHLGYGRILMSACDFVCCVPNQAKATIKQRDEAIAQLKENIGTLTIERDAEVKTCERLRSKNKQLKESDATRGKALDEERQAVAKLKADLREQIEDCNRKLRAALESLNEYRTKHNLPDVENVEDASAKDTSAQIAVEDAQVESSDNPQPTESTVPSLQDQLTTVVEEKNKLEGNLAETLKEFKKLDDFSTNLQSQYEAIHTWYEIFEEWNRTATCSSCKASLDVASIIDGLLEDSKQETVAPAVESVPNEH